MPGWAARSQVARRAFMGGIAVGIEEADGDARDPGPGQVAAASRSSPMSSGRIARPSAAMRSVTSKRRRRGTRGAGLSQVRSNMPGVRSRPISSTSRKPRVVIRPAGPPVPCRMALEPTVVPCSTPRTSAGASLASSSAAAIPSSTAVSGLCGVEGSLRVEIRPVSVISTTSVNVPPISTPIRAVSRMKGFRARSGCGCRAESVSANGGAVNPARSIDDCRPSH